VQRQRTKNLFARQVVRRQLATAEANDGGQQIGIVSATDNQHNDGTNSQHCGKCKDTYGQTIQQSGKTKTPGKLSQAEKRSGQSEAGFNSQSGGLSLTFRAIEKAT
jgi:hypothetical protein